MTTDTHNSDILTLHSSVERRWRGDRSVGSEIGDRHDPVGITDRLIGSLAGLDTIGGRFGADSWDLAGMLAMQPSFMLSAGPAVRAMSLAEIAEIVQVVLEEEEGFDDADWGERSVKKPKGNKAAAAAQAKQAKARSKAITAAQKAQVTAIKRALKAARSQASQRKVTALQQKAAQRTATARQQLQALRSSGEPVSNEGLSAQIQAASVELASAEAEFAGVSDGRFAAIGDSMSGDVGRVGYSDPAPLSTRGLAQMVRQDPARFGFTDAAPSALAQPMSRMAPLSTAGSVAHEQAGSRALRMADGTAELAMLQPGPAAAGSFATWAPAGERRAWGHQTPTDAPAGTASTSLLAGREAQAIRPDGTFEPRLSQQTAGSRSAAGFGRQAAPRATPVAALTAATRTAVDGIRRQTAIARMLRPTPGGANASTAASPSPVRGLAEAASTTFDHFARASQSIGAQTPVSAIARWLSASAPAPDAQAAVFGHRSMGIVPGYAGQDGGAGESLRLRADGDFGLADVANNAGSSPLGLASTPSWLAPAAAAEQAKAFANAVKAERASVGRAVLSPLQGAAAGPSFAAPSAGAVASTRSVGQPTAALSTVQAASSRPSSILGLTALAARNYASTLTDRILGRTQNADTPSFGPAAASGLLGAFARGDVAKSTPFAGGGPVGAASDRPIGGAHAIAGFVDAMAPQAPRAILARESGDTGTFRGDLSREFGAGQWLLPGDDGFDAWQATTTNNAADLPARPRKTPTAPATNSTQTRGQQSFGAGQTGAQAAADQTALASQLRTLQVVAASASQARVASGRDARSGSVALPAGLEGFAGNAGASTPSFANATTAAIQRFVTAHGRAMALDPMASSVALPAGALGLAAEGGADVLRLAPGGHRDALTPWLFAAGNEAGPAAFSFAGEADFAHVAMGTDDAPTAAAESGPTGSIAAVQAAHQGTQTSAERAQQIGAHRKTLLNRALALPAVRDAARRVGATGADFAQPAALNAALAMFGDAGSPVSDGDLGARFVQRFFSHTNASPSEMKGAGRAEMAQIRTASAAESTGRSLSSVRTASPSPETAEASGTKLVVEGLAGLNALRAMTSHEPSVSELMAMGASEQTHLTPTADTATTTPAKRSGRGKSTAVKMHQFAPTALRRGRGLLGRSRGESRLLNVSPNSSSGRHRVGYGAAALGGGALVGLGGADGSSYHGGDFGSSRTVSGAERLSNAVRTRRGTRPGQVGRTMSPLPKAGRGAALPHGLPTHFDMNGDTTFVDTSASSMSESVGYNPRKPSAAATRRAVQQAAGATAAGGIQNAGRSAQASSIARVLSVTASPTANMLPLVAPAARAVAAAAAAKPLAESISTSGANPSMVAPMAGHDLAGQTAGGPGQGSTEKERAESGGTPAQELDQLAMKIARSVMIRIKRERERRGLHG